MDLVSLKREALALITKQATKMTKQDTIEKLVLDVVERHTKYIQPLKEKWTRLYARYENELRSGSITAETEGKIRLGAAFALVENFVSKIIAQNPRFRYLARERGDSKPAEAYNDFNDYQHDVANSQDEYEEIAKWGGICGLAGWKMGWKIEDIIRKKRGKEIAGKKITNPVLLDLADKLRMGKDIKIDETETVSNWTIRAVRPHDLIWDTNFTRFEDSPVKGHRVWKTFNELKSEGYDMSKLAALVKGSTDYWREQMDKYSMGTSQGVVMSQIPLEVAELYIEFMTEAGIKECYVMTVAGVSDGSFLTAPVSIRFESNPFDKQFCPVGVFRPIKRPGKVEGYGVIEPVEGVLNAEEDTLNMNVEAAWTDVSRPMEYVPDNVLNEAELQFKPRTLVPVKELGKSVAIMATPKPDLGAASFLLNFFERAKQNVSAITDYQTGANQLQKSQTATEVNTKTFLSEQRLNKILRSFETEVLEMSGKYALWFNQQYLANSPQIVYRILGKKGSILENQIKFKDIEAVKDLAIVTGSSAYQMQQELRNKWVSLLQLSTQEAMMQAGGLPITREYIWERLAEEGYGIKDTENLIPSLRDREEATVKQKVANIDDAKQENLDPATARVLPQDIHSVHIALHKAALQGQGMPDQTGQTIPYTPEQMVMLTSHLNAHVAAVGGVIPGAAMAMEQAMGQRINNQINPQMPPGGQEQPQGQPIQ
jgi:hypothetical protein